MAVFTLDFISVHLSCMCHNTFFEDLAALPGAHSQFLPFAHTHTAHTPPMTGMLQD